MKTRRLSHCCCAAHPSIEQASGMLRGVHRKVTGPRKAVMELLETQHHPVSAAEIFSSLPKGACDLATVYRVLGLLEKNGLAQRFDLGDGTARFELVRAGSKSHHHHLVCARCADVIEIEECAIHEMEQAIARRHGFKSVSHRLEFFGICPSCQRAG